MATVQLPQETKPHFLRKEAEKLILRHGDDYQLNTSAFHDFEDEAAQLDDIEKSPVMMSDEDDLNCEHRKFLSIKFLVDDVDEGVASSHHP